MRTFWMAALAGAAFSVTAQDIHKLPPVPYVNGVPACPSDTDIRNIDTRLSAREVRPDNERSLRHERWVAVRCRYEGPPYTRADWDRMAAIIRGER